MKFYAVALLLFAFLAMANATTYVDLYNQFNRTQGTNNLWWRDELGGDMTFNAPGSWNASGFPVAGFTNSTTYGKIIGNTGTGGGNQPYTMIVYNVPESKTAGYYVSLTVINTGGQTLTVGLYHNASLVTSVTAAAGARADLNYLVSNVAKSANLTVRFSVSTTQTAFGLYSFRIGDTPQNLQILAFNELTQAVLGFNLTMANSSNTTSFLMVPSTGLNRTLLEIPTGDVTFTFRNYTCLTGNVIPRTFSLTLNVGTNQTESGYKGYMLCDGATVVPQTFLIVDASTGASISNAMVALQRNFGAGYVNLSSMTSSGGTVSFYMDFTSTYQIISDAPGYYHFAAAWNPSQSTTNRLAMVSTNGTAFNYSLANLSYSYGPSLVKLANNVMWFNMTSSDGQLVQYGMDLIAANSTFIGTINYTNATNVYGGNVSVTSDFSLGNYANVTAVLWWIKAGFPRFNSTIVYYPLNATNQNSSLTDAIDQFNQNPPGKTFTGLMAIIITAPVAAWATRYGGPSTGGIVAIGVLAFFTFFGNWLPWLAWGLIVLFVATTLYFIRGRG